jgi:hypothetical protein
VGKRNKIEETSSTAAMPGRLLLTDTPPDWRALVEQIAELEDILLECGAAHDRDALYGRAWLQKILVNKRRQLRDIDVAV